jgi:hypothetical protein
MIGWLADCLSWLMVDWLIGLLVDCVLVGWLVDWLID